MAYTNSKSLVFRTVLSLSLLVGSMTYGMDFFRGHPLDPKNLAVAASTARTFESLMDRGLKGKWSKSGCSVAGYQNEAVPVAAHVKSVRVEGLEGNEALVVTKTAHRYGGRIGYFEVNIDMPEEGSVLHKVKNIEFGVKGFTPANIAKTVATSYLIRLALKRLATSRK